jgi:tRNA/rRNA methyltransferase
MARFILINPSHNGNVGAAARAMKTMGFDELYLVAPRDPKVLNRDETIQRASGATDVLSKTQIVATLDDALHGVNHLCATDGARLWAAHLFPTCVFRYAIKR